MDSNFNKSISCEEVNKTHKALAILIFSFIPISIYFFLIFALLNTVNYAFNLNKCLMITVIVYLSNLLHEVGHYLIGKLLGFDVKKINYSLMFTSVQLVLFKDKADKKSKILISFAGILVNLILMTICITVLNTGVVLSSMSVEILKIGIYMNLALIVINLLPMNLFGIKSDGKVLLKIIRR